MVRSNRTSWAAVSALVFLAAVASQCTPSQPTARPGAGGTQSDLAQAAIKTYVAPGDLDEYYMFASGGHSGNIYVYGLPSMRHLSTIPVFTPYPATGYGFDDEAKRVMGLMPEWKPGKINGQPVKARYQIPIIFELEE